MESAAADPEGANAETQSVGDSSTSTLVGMANLSSSNPSLSGQIIGPGVNASAGNNSARPVSLPTDGSGSIGKTQRNQMGKKYFNYFFRLYCFKIPFYVSIYPGEFIN